MLNLHNHSNNKVMIRPGKGGGGGADFHMKPERDVLLIRNFEKKPRLKRCKDTVSWLWLEILLPLGVTSSKTRHKLTPNA